MADPTGSPGGPERRGALAQATVRIDDEPILLKCTTAQPDALIVLDPTIWHFANVVLGLREGATLIFNTPRDAAEVEDELRSGKHGYKAAASSFQVRTVDATGIALACLGRPITNTAMLGALARATGFVELEDLAEVLVEHFGSRADVNLEAAKAAAAAMGS